MNLVKYRRNLVILLGIIIINVATQIFISYKGFDIIVGCSYFSLNCIWISTIYLSTKEIVDAIDRYLEDETF